MPENSISIRRAQKAFLETASELQDIEGRLATLAKSIVPQNGKLLPRELSGGAQCVRNDLLHDAIETLRALAGASEEDVMRRRHEVDAATQSITAFG